MVDIVGQLFYVIEIKEARGSIMFFCKSTQQPLLLWKVEVDEEFVFQVIFTNYVSTWNWYYTAIHVFMLLIVGLCYRIKPIHE